MKTLRIIGPEAIEVVESEIRIELQQHEVAVRVNRVSLCGSDIKLYQGNYSGPCYYPLIFGHEWSGEIVAVPAGETFFAIGDYVTGDCSCWCGDCSSCQSDKNLCSRVEKFGITIDGYAREIAIINRKYLYRSEQKLPHRVFALTECFAVALHSLKSLGMSSEERSARVLIIGCGAIGTAQYLLLKHHYQFTNLHVCDRQEERVAAIRQVVEEPDLSVYRAVKEMQSAGGSYAELYNEEGFDYILETSGTIAGLDLAIQLANPSGCISYIGFDESGNLQHVKQITMKALTVRGSIGGTGEFEEVIKFLEKNSARVEPMVTLEKCSADAAAGFEEMLFNPSHIKCQIIF
ncbi:zinc-binding dehydrogenase [Paenibacillus sp. NPDC057934]|uniref:zinc-dependent alcohol dehydrogenase n=1 Tax=Paenibacillus sp. NPDC057934 TaxID=3346282 RepID=UPI0036DA5763